MYKLIFKTLILTATTLFLQGQDKKMILPDYKPSDAMINEGSAIYSTPCDGTVSPELITENWGVELKNYSAFYHTSPVSKEAFEVLKNEANKKAENAEFRQPAAQMSGDSLLPFLHKNFRGNLRGTSVPMDNTLAVSRNGFIVSGINTNVIFAQPDGTVTFTKSLDDFFFLLNLGTRMYDPRAIYDPEQNRFIFMCLHGSDPTSTQLCLAFSETEDPNGNWHFYKIDGNPDGDNNWFDYPNIAVSGHDFYLAGLMRNTNGDWQYSVLYQVDKMDGFQGKPLRWKHYNQLFNADGAKAFNLVPTPSGWKDLISPGMYFVSNEALGGDTYNLYFTNESLHNNPVLTSLQANGPATALAPDGRQKSSPERLNTFDSRIWSAMYLDSTIHMGSHVHTGTGNVGLFYGRMNVSNLKVDANVLVTDSIDYGFPSFSAFGRQAQSDTVLVNYLYSGPGLFPGQQQRICTGRNSVFTWSGPVTLKEGASVVSVLDDNRERWGDYTTSSRRFLDERVETWVTGCFGEGGSYGTWLGQYVQADTSVLSIIPDFVADKTTTAAGTQIQFTDISREAGDSVRWYFKNGTPGESTEKSPVVTWAEDGAYDVKLVVQKGNIRDSITKLQYIHIRQPETVPVADFSYDRDTIFRNDTIQFSNQSSPNTKLLRWTFTQGAPGASTETNPRVRYPLRGQFAVSLSALNIAGSNTKTVTKAITVLDRFAPTANFTGNKNQIMPGESIQFSDLSTGGPTSWTWTFEGGEPSTSTIKNPLVTYPDEGTFSVTLQVKNNFGESELVKESFVIVGQSSAKDQQAFFIDRVYPNPVRQEDRVTFTIHVHESSRFHIEILDNNGRRIKSLWDEKVKAGENMFSFNVQHLSGGQYYLLIHDDKAQKAVMPFQVF